MKIIFVDTIYAKWLFICTVTFDGRSATTQPVPASKIVVEGETVGTLPTAPTKTGCTFAGWYTGIVGSGTVFTASTPVTGDITVYALWTMSDGEGNVYKTVSIGSQVWTVENLRTTKYNDGTDIPHVTDGDQWSDLTTPVYCWYDNSTDPAEQEKWGALYNWYAVNTGKLAPEGWRVPTYAEWDTLQNYLIANGYNWDGTTSGNKIAKSMATQTDWTSTTTTGGIGNDPSKNNVSGFSAFPGGRRNDDGNFGLIGLYGFWWSATEYIASSAFYRLLAYNDEYLINGYGYKVYGFSVRLLRD